MKHIAFILFILLVSCVKIGESNDAAPNLSFSNKQAIQAWAESAFGGGRVEGFIINPPGKSLDVIVAYRTHTSGRRSTELNFFVKKNDIYELALHRPMVFEDLHVKQGEESFIIFSRQYAAREFKDEIFSEVKFSELVASK